MKYLTYSGNNLINAHLPDNAEIYYAPPPIPGIRRAEFPQAVIQSFENPLGMPPLRELVNGNSKVLIAFDNNCQPFPPTPRPDFRELAIDALLSLLYSYGVEKKNIRLVCAGGLHRKMKPYELTHIVGDRIMKEFYPHQLENFDAEDRDEVATLGETEEGEAVEIYRPVVESDLVIYVDTVQIALNGGHKSVAVGLGTYRTIAQHHNPRMTADIPHVMQPVGSNMHTCIERISRVVQQHSKIMVMQATMNSAIYPSYLRYLGKPNERCNILEKMLKFFTPHTMALLPEPVRSKIFKGLRSAYEPIGIHTGAIDEVHPETLELLTSQLRIEVPQQFDTVVFGLPDLSPYAVKARINPVLVVSDVLGYVFNWFYNKPLVKKGGAFIIINPAHEVFHHEYHVPYRRFYDDVLTETTDPLAMQKFHDRFACDPRLTDCYRNRYAYHGYHPFTVWYWATYPLQYLSRVILVGPKDGRVAKRLGVSWAPSLNDALTMAKEASGGDDVAALTIPPFFYANVP
jgi:hypothetical protein